MRYLIGLMAVTLIGCASAASSPIAGQGNSRQIEGWRAEGDGPASPLFVGHWNNEDLSKETQPAALDVHSDGSFAIVSHDGDHSSGKWTATSKTSATFTEAEDPEVVTGQLSGNDEMIVMAAGEPPLKFKRQR
jgi:hypothetical protein